jgi:phenylalanyl-tRNA synthetase beta chain
VAGKVSEDILDNWDIKRKNVLFAQIDMEEIYRRTCRHQRYEPFSEFPAISRDISLAVPMTVLARDIERSIRKTVGEQEQVILTDIRFIEKYEGDKISKEHRGLIFSLTYQSRLARTLRDEEVTEVHEKVCGALVNGLGVIRR